HGSIAFSRDQKEAVGAESHGAVWQGVFSPWDREAEKFSLRVPDPRVPDPNGIADRGDEMAFGVPGHTEGTAPELGAQLAGLRVPDFHDLVEAGRSNPPAVGAERHAADFIAVFRKRQRFLAGFVPPERGPVPDANGPVEAG